jgi:hypothetical protein
MIANWGEDLDAAGFVKTKILITEYRFNLWNRLWQTPGAALAEGVRMMLQASSPRVTGIFIHNTPGNALFNYSNGTTWSLTRPPGVPDWPAQVKNGHVIDTHPELGPRYRMLPTGCVQSLLAEACRGELIDAFALGEYGTLTYLLSRKDGEVRLLTANLQAVPVAVKLPGFRVVSAEVFHGKSLDAQPADTAAQPYGVTSVPFNGTVPAHSLTLMRLRRVEGTNR